MRKLAVLLLLTLSLSCGSSKTQKPHFRNLVVVVIDTLRSDHLASYGYHRDTAPTLSRLAAEGIQLQGVSASSWTKTSVATLLTGLHPQRHVTNSGSEVLPAGVPLLTEILAESGYSTFGYQANPVAGSAFGFSRGFQQWAEGLLFEGLGVGPFLNPLAEFKPHADWASAVALEMTTGFSTPFYAYVQYLDPHAPYVPRRSWDGAAPEEYVWVRTKRKEDLERRDRLWFDPQDPRTLRGLVNQYDASIRETDAAIDRLLEGLAAQGLLEDTLVVITSDHGEEFMEHGRLGHALQLYEESLRIPFILWSQNGLHAGRSDAVFHQVDFLPTVLEALGHEPPPGLDGTSRWQQILTGEYQGAAERLHCLGAVFPALAIVEGDRKLIHQKQGHGRPSNLLFELTRDSTELDSLDLPAARERLLRDLLGRHNELSGNAFPRESRSLTERQRAALIALGYLNALGQVPEPDELRDRIPDRLRFYDAREFGLFGDERPADFSPRIRFEGDSAQLLRGWRPSAEGKGAWSLSSASCVLPATPGTSELYLRGRLPDARHDLRLTVRVNGDRIATLDIPRGPFEETIPISDPIGPFLYIDLEVDPALQAGQRELGLLFQEVRLD